MTPASLDVSGVTWTPKNSPQPVLHPTSFSVAAGRVMGVVGPNGAGKSTLLRLLYRYQKPHSGQIKVNGQDIWSMSARQTARRIAAVLQEQASALSLIHI